MVSRDVSDQRPRGIKEGQEYEGLHVNLMPSLDSDRVLPLPVSSKRFRLIPRRRGQNLQFCSRVELEQLPQGHAFDGAKTLAVMILKEFRGVPRAKAALDHTLRIPRIVIRKAYEPLAHRWVARLGVQCHPRAGAVRRPNPERRQHLRR